MFCFVWVAGYFNMLIDRGEKAMGSKRKEVIKDIRHFSRLQFPHFKSQSANKGYPISCWLLAL